MLQTRYSCNVRAAEIWTLAALELRVHGCPFLGACWMNGPMRCKTAEPRSVPVRAHSHKLFYVRTLAITSRVFGSDHFQLFFSCPYVQLSPRSGARAKMAEWLVSSFSKCCVPLHSVCEGPPFPYVSHFPSGPASGPEKQSPCRLIGMRGRTIRRGIHGSTSEHRNGLCALVPDSQAYLGATAFDTGS